MKIPPTTVRLMIEATERRHTKMQEEVTHVVHNSREYMAKMFAHDYGFEIDEVVKYQEELAIIAGFILDIREPEGFRVHLVSYMDDLKHAIVSVNLIKK